MPPLNFNIASNTGDYRNYLAKFKKNPKQSFVSSLTPSVSPTVNQSKVEGIPKSPFATTPASPSATTPTLGKASPAKTAFVQNLAQAPSSPTVTGTATTPSGAVVNPTTGQTISTPAPDPKKSYTDAFDAYIRSLSPTPQETEAQSYLSKLLDTSRREEEKAFQSGETLGFAGNEVQRVNRNRSFDIQAASDVLGALTGQRTAMTEAQKARLEFEKSMLPAAEKAPEGFTLGEGQTRYDAEGNIIAGGGGLPSLGAYSPGSNPEVDAYVTAVKNKQTSLENVPTALRGLVAQGLAATPSVNADKLSDASIVLNKVNDALGKLGFFSSSLPGQFTAWLKGTPAGTLNSIYGTLKSKIGFNELQMMRDASPTGGALGQVSNIEIQLLADSIAALDVGLGAETQRKNLEEITDYFNKFQEDQILKYEMNLGRELTDDEIRLLLEGRDIGNFSSAGNASASNLPQKNNNPGNIKAGGLADSYAVGRDSQGHLIFPDPETGFMALEQDLRAKIDGRSRNLPPNPTLAQLGSVYAEDPRWTNSVAAILGVSPSTKTASINFDRLLQAIARQEGFYA